MKTTLIFTLFTLAGSIPVYTHLCWIYVFNAHPGLSQIEKQALFNKRYFLGLDGAGNPFIGMFVALLGLSAVIYFGYRLKRKKIAGDSAISTTSNVSLFIIFAFFTLLSVWGIL